MLTELVLNAGQRSAVDRAGAKSHCAGYLVGGVKRTECNRFQVSL
jgi:hypothetical protein